MRQQIKLIWWFFIFVQFLTACSPQSANSQEVNTTPESEQRFILVLPRKYWLVDFPRKEEEVTIFSSAWDGTDLRPLFDNLGPYTYVENISSARQQLLVSSSSNPRSLPDGEQHSVNLYLWHINEADPVSLSNAYLPRLYPSLAGALWASDSIIVYIGIFNGEINLLKTELESGLTTPILDIPSSFVHPPLHLLTVSTDNLIYWQNGIIGSESAFIEAGFWRVRSNGEDLEKVGTKDGTQLPIFSVSPDGTLIVLGKDIIDNNFNKVAVLPLENDPDTLYWSESSNQLFLSMKSCQSPDCSQYQMSYYIWDRESLTATLTRVNIDIEVSRAIWSPDEDKILLYNYQGTGNTRRLVPMVYDVASAELLPVLTELEAVHTGDDFDVFWEP